MPTATPSPSDPFMPDDKPKVKMMLKAAAKAEAAGDDEKRDRWLSKAVTEEAAES